MAQHRVLSTFDESLLLNTPYHLKLAPSPVYIEPTLVHVDTRREYTPF